MDDGNLELLDRLESSVSASSGQPDLTVKKLLEGYSDEFYFWLLTDGYGKVKNDALKSLLPAMPDEKTQLKFNAKTGNDSLGEAFSAYRLFKELCRKRSLELRDCRNVLDFGCGWGRFARVFLKDVEPSALYGVDVLKDIVELSRSSVRGVSFEAINPLPPCHFPGDKFDLVYLFSVFSHLSEGATMRWVAEFHRMLRPGGVLIATTRSRSFIEYCERLRQRQVGQGPFMGAAKAFLDTRQTLADYDNGKFCHTPVGPLGVQDSRYYGETAMPKKYVEENWTRYFPDVEYIYDTEHKSFSQDVIVARKK
ncbi:MAG: class I SAM-dependent methyltransferase [Nitrospirae bacterium]|nr:class I SAM-dependent methyltransferase [Nitrospirota bacterium]MBI5694200.1 class I SAM-dependent methyltransferase [Nitrospirota bacterium]